MVDVWLDAVTPKDSLLIDSLIPSLQKRGYKTLITAKNQTQTTEILDLLKLKYICIGEYGQNLKEKLMVEQKRTLEFLDLFEKIGLPKVLWTHGDVSAIRTAFGVQIPIVYANDTPHATHVAKLVCPLVNCLVAPEAFGKSWSKYGISKSRIALYDGIEEVAWMKDSKFGKLKFLEELSDKKPVVLFRNVEYKASYFKDAKVNTWRLVKKLSKTATIVYLPRYKEEIEKLQELENIWIPPTTVLTAQLIPFIDVAIGSGGTICRETALMGIPTINFHFWDVISQYLHRKGFPIKRIRDTRKIILKTREMLRKTQNTEANDKKAINELKSPIPLITHYIDEFF